MPRAIDLVCWDFGDTLVDERFMQIPPNSVEEWPEAYRQAFHADPDFAERLDLGEASLTDLIPALSAHLPGVEQANIARHLRTVWRRIEWVPEARRWVEWLDGRVCQAVVTVNPHEFHGIATACGLDEMVDVIVTSADVVSLSKPTMAAHARSLLGLPAGLDTSILIDNTRTNVGDFEFSGGRGVHFDRATIDAALGSALGEQFGEPGRDR